MTDSRFYQAACTITTFNPLLACRGRGRNLRGRYINRAKDHPLISILLKKLSRCLIMRE